VFSIIVQWLIITASVAAAAVIVPGIHIDDGRGISALLIMSAVLAIVNMLVRPVLAFLSCGLIILTLGFFLLVVNALAFWIASGIASDVFDAGFNVNGFWSAFFGAMIVSVVSWMLSVFVSTEER
jgi:putative membrane protein